MFQLRRFMWETRDKMQPCFFCEGVGPSDGCPRCSHRESGPKKKEVYSFVNTRENVRKLMAEGKGKAQLKNITDVGAALRRFIIYARADSCTHPLNSLSSLLFSSLSARTHSLIDIHSPAQLLSPSLRLCLSLYISARTDSLTHSLAN